MFGVWDLGFTSQGSGMTAEGVDLRNYDSGLVFGDRALALVCRVQLGFRVLEFTSYASPHSTRTQTWQLRVSRCTAAPDDSPLGGAVGVYYL